MTLQEAVCFGEKKLLEAQIADAALDAWYLLEYVSGVSRAMYFAEPKRILEPEKETAYIRYIEARAAHVPLQHITGEQEFMGLSFAVSHHVLVPRQETELLVEEGLRFLQPGMDVLDMCTGSGCILISLLKFCGNKRPGLWKNGPVNGVGVDISPEALAIARKNAATHEVQAAFLHGDLYEAFYADKDTLENGSFFGKRFDLIVSNPPYIRTAVIQELQEEVRLHDPWIALDGKEDGLYFYRKIIEGSGRFLKKGGRILFEIGYDQGEAVSKLLSEAGFSEITVKKDLAGLDRIVSGVYN